MARQDILDALHAEHERLTAEMKTVEQILRMMEEQAEEVSPKVEAIPHRRERRRVGGTQSKLPAEKNIHRVFEAAKEISKGGSYVESIPGSFTSRQVAQSTGLSIGVVRAALTELSNRGMVQLKEKMTWRALGEPSPKGSTSIFVIPAEKREEGERPRWGRTNLSQTEVVA